MTEILNKRILVVEDEGLIADDIQRRLQRLGYPTPPIVNSGPDALRCARSTTFDLVLMDIRLKGDMDGVATAQKLKSELDTPVVYITAHADRETLERAKLTEPLGYLLKPITDADLRTAVEIALYKAEMERRLRVSEGWLSATLKSVGEGIIVTDPAGEIISMNPIAEHLTGWAAADAFGSQIMDVLHLLDEIHQLPAKNPVCELFAGESRAYFLTHKAGARKTVEIECSENVSDSGVLGSIVILRDIGRRKETEAQLIQAQRMEAIANLAGGLAHDFNNQLMVILGYADCLARELSGEQQEAAVEIQKAGAVAESITRQLLTLGRRDTSRFEILEVNALVSDVQALLAHSLGKEHRVNLRLGSPSGYIRADRNRIKQVILNLAINARDAMPSSGEFRIETSIVDIDPDTPASRLQPPGPCVRLLFSDTGEGMDSATLARIFEPLFTTKAPGFGTGLGLSVAHSIIAQAGGSITAKSETGNGTTFEILLPCVGAFCAAPCDPPHAESAGAPAAPTVLLVEDEDCVRRLMHKFLEHDGYQLLEARNGIEAQDLAGVYQNPIDILVTDVVMPGMSGPELAARLAPLHPGMKVLFVSGYRHDAPEAQGAFDRSVNLLPKPFPASELIRRIQLLLRSQRSVAE